MKKKMNATVITAITLRNIPAVATMITPTGVLLLTATRTTRRSRGTVMQK